MVTDERPTVWTKDMPEPPHGVDVLLDEGDRGGFPYLCRWSPNSWFWEHTPEGVKKREKQTGLTWSLAVAQAVGELRVVWS